MRVLVGRLDLAQVKEGNRDLSAELSRLDTLTNGLMSRALYHGVFFENPATQQKNPGPWIYFKPRYQKFSSLMIWSKSGKIDWDALLELHPTSEIVLDSRSIDKAEQERVEKIFPEGRVKLWPKRGDEV